MLAQMFGPLPSKWEAWIESLAHGFRLADTWLADVGILGEAVIQ